MRSLDKKLQDSPEFAVLNSSIAADSDFSLDSHVVNQQDEQGISKTLAKIAGEGYGIFSEKADYAIRKISGPVSHLKTAAAMTLSSMAAVAFITAACSFPNNTPVQAPTSAPSIPTRTQTPAYTPTFSPVPTATSAPTSTPYPTPTATSAPTSTPYPTPTATSAPTSTPYPTPTATSAPTPTPSLDRILQGYSPLLIEAISKLPPEFDFARDGLSSEEKQVLEWADSRIFENPAFLSSKYGPKSWPSEVKLASVQAIPLLMQNIDIQKKSDGKHVIDWEAEVDTDGVAVRKLREISWEIEPRLDKLLDDLNVYKGVCIPSCYGEDNYDTREKHFYEHNPIVNDPRHVHREMLKTFAYFAKADGEGILIRSFMENNSKDLELLYKRDVPLRYKAAGPSFGWRNSTFVSRAWLPNGTFKTLPTRAYEIVGDAESEMEAAERVFEYLNTETEGFRANKGRDFHDSLAELYNYYSQSPYTPEAAHILRVGRVSGSYATGAATALFRSLGLKAEQFISPGEKKIVGSVEIDGKTHYYQGTDYLNSEMPTCAIFTPSLNVIENKDYDLKCEQ